VRSSRDGAVVLCENEKEQREKFFFFFGGERNVIKK
jgi:hypothetical protein